MFLYLAISIATQHEQIYATHRPIGVK